MSIRILKKNNYLRLSFSGSLLFLEKNGASVQNKKAKPESQFRKRFQEKRPESNTYSRSQALDFLLNMPCFCGIRFLRNYLRHIRTLILHVNRFRCRIDVGSYRISLRSSFRVFRISCPDGLIYHSTISLGP